MKSKTLDVRFKAGPDDGLQDGEFLVYPSTFIRVPDDYGDVVAKGAFADTIQEWKASGKTLPGLYGHRLDDPDYNVAGALDMGEDDHGWWVRGAFDLDQPKAAQVYRLVKAGRLNQLSFMYDTLDEGQIVLDDGTKANELRKLKVYEFSFVPIGANQDTSVVAVKAAADMLARDLKAGRVLSAKNENALRDVLSTLEGASAQLKEVLTQVDEGDDQEKAVGHAPVIAEAVGASPSVSVEEPKFSPSVGALALEIQLLSRP